jgi:hypothetical protein
MLLEWKLSSPKSKKIEVTPSAGVGSLLGCSSCAVKNPDQDHAVNSEAYFARQLLLLEVIQRK